MTTKLAHMHPGEVLREEFLKPLSISAGQVARALSVPRTRIERLAAEQVELTADTALRLARYFGTSAEFWLNLHSRWLIESTQDRLGAELQSIRPLAPAE